MFKLKSYFWMTLALLATVSTAYAADYKIGVVNAVKVMQAAPQAEAAMKKLESEFSGRDKQIANEQKSLKTLEDRMAKDAAIMSESERTRLERDIINKRRDLKRSADEFREDVQFRRNEEMGKIQRLILEAINGVASEGKYDLVLGEGVLFSSKAVDISDLVIAKMKRAGR